MHPAASPHAMTSRLSYVPLAILLDIAALNANVSIDRNTNERVRSGLLNCVMKFYLSSPKAYISEIVPSASFLFQLEQMKKAN